MSGRRAGPEEGQRVEWKTSESMRSTTPNPKRDRLAADVEAYLASGKRIQQIPPGVTGEIDGRPYVYRRSGRPRGTTKQAVRHGHFLAVAREALAAIGAPADTQRGSR